MYKCWSWYWQYVGEFMRVLFTTCSTDAPLLIMMASLKSGRSKRKKKGINVKKASLSWNAFMCMWRSQWGHEVKLVNTSSFLGINANQGQVFPQCLQKVIQVQLHPTTEIYRLKKERKKKRSAVMNSCIHEKSKMAAANQEIKDIWPDDSTVSSASQAIHLLDGDLIHFIVHL